MTNSPEAFLPHRFITALNDLGFAIDKHTKVALQPLQSIVLKWNQALRLKGEARFRDAEPHPQTQQLVPIAPIPFTVTGWPIHVVFWGLNPHYDAGALQEKIVASSYHVEEPPGTWYSYAQFYLNYPFSASAPWPGSLLWAIHSRYYYNLGTITGTLKDKQFTLLKDKYDEAVDPSQKRLQAFWDIAKDYGIMAAEYLPMHSRKTVTRTLGPGSSVTKQVQAYHTTLLQTIMQVLEPDGWIVAMGNPCTRAVRQLLSQNGTLTKMQHVNGAIVLETWTPRDSTSSFKVSFGPFIGTAGGALNSTAAVENWLGHMLAY